MSSAIRVTNLLWVLVLVICQVFVSAQNATTPKECCENDENLMIEGKCAADKSGKVLPTTLKCKEKFVLDPISFPEEDSFNITGNGSLEAADFKYLVPPDE